MTDQPNGDKVRVGWREYIDLRLEPMSSQLSRVEQAIQTIDANMTTRSEFTDLRHEIHSLRQDTNSRIAALERKLQIAQWIFNFVMAIFAAVAIALLTGIIQ